MGDIFVILVLYFIGKYISSASKTLKEQKNADKGKPSPVKAPKARPNKAQRHSRKDRKAEAKPVSVATAAKPEKVARVSEPVRASRTAEPIKATINAQEDYFSFHSSEEAYIKPERKTVDKKPRVAASASKAAKLFSAKGIAGAVVMSEILDKPLALREEYK